MSAATLTPAAAGPITQTHQLELAAAREAAKPIRKAARVATFNGWTTGIVAALSALFALTGLAGLLVFAGLAVVAWNEFRGRRRLLDFDPSAATLLGWNQLGLLAMIVVYSLWALWSGLAGASSLESQLQANPQLKTVIDSIEGFDDLYRQLVVVLYGSVIVLSTVFQGANAIYYFTRRKLVAAYVRDTPPWVLNLQRAARAV